MIIIIIYLDLHFSSIILSSDSLTVLASLVISYMHIIRDRLIVIRFFAIFEFSHDVMLHHQQHFTQRAFCWLI